jgi:hypothetical protein
MFGIFNKICPYILILIKIAQNNKHFYMKTYVQMFPHHLLSSWLRANVLCEKCTVAKETGECRALSMIDFKHWVLMLKWCGMYRCPYLRWLSVCLLLWYLELFQYVLKHTLFFDKYSWISCLGTSESARSSMLCWNFLTCYITVPFTSSIKPDAKHRTDWIALDLPAPISLAW